MFSCRLGVGRLPRAPPSFSPPPRPPRCMQGEAHSRPPGWAGGGGCQDGRPAPGAGTSRLCPGRRVQEERWSPWRGVSLCLEFRGHCFSAVRLGESSLSEAQSPELGKIRDMIICGVECLARSRFAAQRNQSRAGPCWPSLLPFSNSVPNISFWI